ncbi:hypothetical protein [Thalassotalea sp. SU-HH00458]|uniref:hypothetical protein n=1 Tax=Thalassotalea sp. SU-HH00458 TaxID=3127657 RepID=UPI003103F1CC
MKKYLTFALVFTSLLSSEILAEQLKIASWNMAWLSSHKYNKRVDKDYLELSTYAKKLDADIIALQEVEDAIWASKVFGDEYDYYFSTKNWVQSVGVANRLMYQASLLMIRLAESGIVVLPIHDGFIVQQRYVNSLRDMMVNCFRTITEGEVYVPALEVIVHDDIDFDDHFDTY